MKAMESTKRKLVLQGSILKTRGSEADSSEALSSKTRHQKLTSSKDLKVQKLKTRSFKVC